MRIKRCTKAKIKFLFYTFCVFKSLLTLYYYLYGENINGNKSVFEYIEGLNQVTDITKYAKYLNDAQNSNYKQINQFEDKTFNKVSEDIAHPTKQDKIFNNNHNTEITSFNQNNDQDYYKEDSEFLLNDYKISLVNIFNFDNRYEHTYERTNENKWLLSTERHDFNEYQKTAYCANGYIGTRVPFLGTGYLDDRNFSKALDYSDNGWPLFNKRYTGSFVAGFWNAQNSTPGTNFNQTGYESILSSIPIWNSIFISTHDNITLHTNEHLLNNITNYRQSLSIQNGIVTTSFHWWPHGVNDKNFFFLNINYTVIAHQTMPNLGIVKLDINPSKSIDKLKIIDILDGQGSWRTTFNEKSIGIDDLSLLTSVFPEGINDTVVYEFSKLQIENNNPNKQFDFKNIKRISHNDYFFISSNKSTVAIQGTLPKLEKNEKISIIKYVAITSSDLDLKTNLNNVKLNAQNIVQKATRVGYESLLNKHLDAWNDIWNSGDIIVPGNNRELQLSTRSSLFHLITSLRSGFESPGFNDNSCPVSGLSSDSYGGLIFWDADLWIYLAVLPFFPAHAKSIINYRLKTHTQAQENAYQNGLKGALYPWTSGKIGKCTGTGPCIDYQYHLNTDIAFSAWSYYLATGDEDFLRNEAWPLLCDAANMFESYVIKKYTLGGKYVTIDLTDPDEYANHVDNGAFTNIGIIQLMKWAISAGDMLGINDNQYNEKIREKWNDIADNMYIEYNSTSDIILEYTGMNGSTVIKQADVCLINFPLDYEMPGNIHQPLNDFEFYSRAQSSDGPAMSWAIYSIAAHEHITSGSVGFTYLISAFEPFNRQPFYQFSEQMDDDPNTNGGTNPAFPFLTGHGGYIQSWIYGLGGIRLKKDYLFVNATYPAQLGNEPFILKGIKWKTASFDISVGPMFTTVFRKLDERTNEYSHLIEPLKASIGFPAINSIDNNNKINGDSEKINIGLLLPNESLTFKTRRPDLYNPKGNLMLNALVLTDSEWVPGKYPSSVVDGSKSSVWQSKNFSGGSLFFDLGAEVSIRRTLIDWRNIPAEHVSLCIYTDKFATNITNFMNKVISNRNNLKEGRWLAKNLKVDITEPYNKEKFLEVGIRKGNNTNILSTELEDDDKNHLEKGSSSTRVYEGYEYLNFLDLERKYYGRYVHLQVYGSMDEKVACTIGEIEMYGYL